MPATVASTLDIMSHSPDHTRQVGRRLARWLQAGDVILLSGRLGSGKTHLAQGIGAGLGIEESIRSPTFTLINEYDSGRLPFYHVDLYRLHGEREAATIGLEEFFQAGDGVVVVEWPEQAAALLPSEALSVSLSHVADNQRAIVLSARGDRYQALLRALATGVGGDG
ncbi:MAG TPA: tRNA (adenosine(37)-N6)-threonylcarbamoyltransferase complex ATPase subunit type 1 TsaE [Ardenticatenaceae bacterium]|nr:tRNA (adenosine(37)-N6)-threonylcarbamoyltransferase complex ATPase subunit type 1 TsaE [Ardenticatenaceae bacterium]